MKDMYIKTYFIHLVLKSPIIIHAKRVDKAGVLVEDWIETDKLVSVNLLSVSLYVGEPSPTNPLQHSGNSSVPGSVIGRVSTEYLLADTL